MNKTIRTLHAWGGAILALLFMLLSLTGIFLVWKQEYLLLTVPEARVDFTPTPASLAVIGEGIDRNLGDKDIISVQFATRELPLTLVLMADEQYAYVDTQGNVIDEWTGNGRFEEWVYDLHHRLLLKDTGLNIVGFSSLLMILLLIAGVITFWPRRKGLRLGFVPKDLSRLQLLKTHRNIGIFLAAPFLLTLVTGVVLVYPSQIEEWLLGEMRSTQEYSDAMSLGLDAINGEGTGDWLPALQRAGSVFPGATIRSAQVPGDFSYYRILGLQQPGELSRQGLSRVYIGGGDGYMDIRIDALNLPLVEKAYNTAYPLHTGKMNKLWYRLLLTLSGACIFVVSCFGLVSFVRQFRR